MNINRFQSSSTWLTYCAKIFNLVMQNKDHIFCKYLPTSIMLMLSAYIYSLLRGVKDSVLVPILGAELISVVKFCGVFPSTVIFFICFTKLANRFSREKLYYMITLFFICFFMFYAFVLSPFQDFIHPDLSHTIAHFPKFKYQLLMIQHWSVSLFYIMSELCGTVMLTLLFWQFANDIYTVSEARKTYAIFGLIGQLGLIAAGIVQQQISSNFLHQQIEMVKNNWETTLQWLMCSVFAAGIGLIYIYYWMNKNVIPNPKLCERVHTQEKEKISLSLRESFRYVFSSKYLWLIMMIVFCYGLGINLVETVWKDQLRHHYTSQNSFSVFMGKFNIYFGIVTLLVMVSGTYILRTYKWIVSASITPVGVGITGCIFFTLIIFQDIFKPWINDIGTSVLLMSVILGSIQVILFKSLNYCFVDATKEMTFIPLDRELRIKGKAAVDVIGGRFGKSCGAVLFQLMFHFINPNVANLTKEIFSIFVVTVCLWIFSVISLNKKFLALTATKTHHE